VTGKVVNLQKSCSNVLVKAFTDISTAAEMMPDNTINITKLARTATHSCRTWKRIFHVYSPCVVRCSHTAVRQMRPRFYAATTAAVAADDIGTYSSSGDRSSGY